MIRSARPADLPRLREVEVAAGALFRTVGMDRIADDDPPSLQELAAFQERGRAWVVTGEAGGGVPVGYLLLDLVDGAAHVEQVSVDPACARRRLGASLLETAAGWAAARGLPALTLTTFADVPWNAPHYARLGFAVLPADRLGPGLRGVVERERAHGLHAWPRVVMRRDLGPAGADPASARPADRPAG
ncbi:GNAT family N-acetyltransferase [Kineococcus sp. SYSU DK006]|uniref:GNAT family N-acetyltransferase n=1 Tax=Kineococcus sp. SYSU DK006 TaxID=3383127 RepID=UPI003D7D3AA3